MSRIEFNTTPELASLAENETIRVYEESRELILEEFQGDLNAEFYIASQGRRSEGELIEIKKSILMDFSMRNAETLFMHYPEVIFVFGKPENTLGKVNLYHPSIPIWVASNRQIAN